MKFMTRVTIPNEAGNALCSDKEMNAKMESVMSDVRPETVYFGVENGQRTIYCIVNVDAGHELPRIAEPFWLALKANVEFIPVMNQEEFKKAQVHIESASKKYNK